MQKQFRIPDHESSNLCHVVPAATCEVGGSFIPGRKALGHIELWSCLACGFSEMYSALAGVEALARAHPDQVRIVDTTPPRSGPHR